jgi:hypothetical protein
MPQKDLVWVNNNRFKVLPRVIQVGVRKIIR